ncbi:MAG: glycosyl hydrolase 108 family protein [Bacteroidota bacterium]
MFYTIIGGLLALGGILWRLFKQDSEPTSLSPSDKTYSPSMPELELVEEDPVLTEILDTIPVIQMPAVDPETIKPVMASFDIAYKIVANHEGGYQKLKNDPGNFNSRGQLVGTNWGINAKVYEGYLGRPPSEKDMRAMSKTTAKSIYKRNYWDPIKGDQLPDQQLANFMFDGHVNHGSWGIKLMQRVLGLREDGALGPITLKAILSKNPRDLFNAYKKARIRFYHGIVERKPEMRHPWLGVWLRRMDSFVYKSSGSSPNGQVAQNTPKRDGGGLTAVALAAAFFLLS